MHVRQESCISRIPSMDQLALFPSPFASPPRRLRIPALAPATALSSQTHAHAHICMRYTSTNTNGGSCAHLRVHQWTQARAQTHLNLTPRTPSMDQFALFPSPLTSPPRRLRIPALAPAFAAFAVVPALHMGHAGGLVERPPLLLAEVTRMPLVCPCVDNVRAYVSLCLR